MITKKTCKILIMLLIIIGSILVCSKVYAKGGFNANYAIYDKNGVNMRVEASYTDDFIYDSTLNYEGCYAEIYLYKEENQYEQSIVIDKLGTFNFLEKRTDEYNGTYLVYRANTINRTLLETPGNIQDVNFKIKNLKTGLYEEFETGSGIYTYKNQFENNANLSIDGIDIVKNGKCLIRDSEIRKGDTFIGVYTRICNCLYIDEHYANKIKFNNMGKNFEITVESGKWLHYYPYSGLKYSMEGDLPNNTFIDAEKITSGKLYNNVVNTLDTKYKNLYIYDISVNNFYTNKKVQTNEKIKLYIPIENDIDKSNIEVYRIESNGEKIKYNATIEDERGTKYATFETDHFSTYVVAEKTSATQSNTNENLTDNKNQKNTKQHILDDEPKAGNNDISKIVKMILLFSTIGLTKFIRINKQ